jgi:hypothetical protein
MKARIESTFECKIETIIKYVNLSSTLDYISHPILKFVPVDFSGYPERWENGRYDVSIKLFSLIPFGRQHIQIEKIKEDDPNRYIIRDNGSGDIVKTWDHWIYINKVENSELTSYVDQVEIKAGAMTFFIWIFAHVFYRWRQYRWKKLIRNSFNLLKKLN